MKMGIFDSGLGGLLLLKAIADKLPKYDYIYLGDTQRVPYGGRSQETIYQFTKEAVDYLFRKNCDLVILACNTASTRALRRLQREYIPQHYPNRRVLGVIIPTVEIATNDKEIKRVGVLATQATASSNAFTKEFKKLNPKVKVYEQAAPLLVPLIENDSLKFADPILSEYIKPLLSKNVNVILLGCTHYSILKSKFRKLVGKSIKIISQDELLPTKLENYLKRHPALEKRLSKNGKKQLLVTDITVHNQHLAQQWFGKNVKLQFIKSLR